MSKVFCIGLPKTGTTSIYQALEQLGYSSVRYSFIDKDNVTKLVLYDDLKRYDAAGDIQVSANYQRLDVDYPGFKFILTVRELEVWLRSICVAEYYYGYWNDSKKEPIHEPPLITNERALFRWNCLQELFPEQPRHFDRDYYVTQYLRHSSKVLNYFGDRRTSDLLVFDVAVDGWKKLCKFLNKDIPKGPFPYTHKTPFRWNDKELKPKDLFYYY